MLILPAKLTVQEARAAQRMLSQALQHDAQKHVTNDLPVLVDASALLHFDSAALAVLLECQRLAQAWGKGFAVRQAPPKLAELARLYGVAELLMPPEGAVSETETAPA